MSEQKSANSSQKRSSNSAAMTKGLAVVGITTSYIFGPMIFFGGIGWWLSQQYDNKIFLFVGLIIALISSNLLIFKRTETLLKKITKK